MEKFDYILYVKGTPLSESCYKIGISAVKNIYARLGTYQNAFGPSYQERFDRIWAGPEQDIRELERLLKGHFKYKMAGRSRGYTEWVNNISFEEVVQEIETLSKQLGVLISSPIENQKLFEEDIEKLENILVETA